MHHCHIWHACERLYTDSHTTYRPSMQTLKWQRVREPSRCRNASKGSNGMMAKFDLHALSTTRQRFVVRLNLHSALRVSFALCINAAGRTTGKSCNVPGAGALAIIRRLQCHVDSREGTPTNVMIAGTTGALSLPDRSINTAPNRLRLAYHDMSNLPW